jgi:hypothetical protein
VTLASGEVIQINRHVLFRQEGAWGTGGGLSAPTYTTSSIDIIPSDREFVRWDAPMIPILIDRDEVTKEWIVIAGHDNPSFWNANGKPCPPQWAFRLRAGVWYVQPVPESLLGRLPNLLADLRVTDDREYSEATFAAVALERKASQLLPYPKIGPELVRVGVVYKGLSHCKSPGSPTFGDDFWSPGRYNSPSLREFPRL